MSRKKWLIASAILLLTGVLACGIAFVVLGFDFGKLSTVAYVTNTYDVQDSFHSITINADTEKITFVRSEDKKCRVVCREEERDPHKVRVDGDTLIVERENKKQLHFSIWIVTGSQEITVYLPEDAYDALSIDSDTGDISVTDVSASGLKLKTDTGKIEANRIKLSGDMDIHVDTGKTILTDISCRNFMSNGDTGDLIMTNVIASGEFNLERTTGDIEFNSCDADTIYVRTNTGDVSGTLLTDKVFITDTDTGRIDVPKTITGGRCEISTDTGDIKLQIQ